MSKFTAWPVADKFTVDTSVAGFGETREDAITDLLENVLNGVYNEIAVWTGNNKTFTYRLVWLDPKV